MTLGKPRVSCIPCAKRKVRCDKSQPCNHCKRRRQDKCEYPSSASVSAARPNVLSQRIDRLEQYIRSLGVDPASAIPDAENVSQQTVLSESSANTAASSPKSTPQASSCVSRDHHVTGLIEHDEEVSYIETPMWFSWTGSGQNDRSNHSGLEFPHASDRICREPRTLIDSTFSARDAERYPVPMPLEASKLKALWQAFQKNVHPLLKIFYDWEVDLLIQKACHGPNSLSPAERALVSSIIFISTYSLLPEECQALLGQERLKLVHEFQNAAEASLLLADYATTTNRLVFQALLLYLIAMNHRARPAAVFAMMGVAERIALRMGLHRDGEALGLDVFRSEERRRMWWQFQMQEVAVVRNLGTLNLTLYGDWDVQRPSNLDDADLRPNLETLPPPKKKLTSMANVLWLYQVLFMLRSERKTKTRQGGVPYMLSPHVSLAEKEAVVDEVEDTLSSMYLQYCDLLDPNHLFMHIGIRQYALASRRTLRQPALINAKISEMSRQTRNEFLEMCIKSLEYLILVVTSEALQRFRWFSCFQFQMLSLVYVILEAHHRVEEDSVTEIWDVIRRLYAAHPDLKSARDNREFVFAARIMLAAWHKRAAHVQKHNAGSVDIADIRPAWIMEICTNFDLTPPSITVVNENENGMDTEMEVNAALGVPLDFDFDLLDWTAWEDLGGVQ